MPDAPVLTLDRHGAVALLTIARPDRLNALPDPGDGARFSALCDEIDQDPAIGCAVITGAGRAFSAGGDVKAMRDRRGLFAGSAADIREAYRREVHAIMRALYGLRVPLIAAVNGPAVGLGCGVAGVADIRLATPEATFGVPFVKLGLIAGDGDAWLLPRNVGYARAAELLFTADLIDAATAERWGLVNRIVPADRLLDEAMGLASRIAAQPPLALRGAKALLRQGRNATFDDILEASGDLQADLHLSEDHAEGVAAHLERRPGRFTGR
jgi:2-(1,2-epoxy-1,2-dihydrophenyl)acetyl-CoA isomerase